MLREQSNLLCSPGAMEFFKHDCLNYVSYRWHQFEADNVFPFDDPWFGSAINMNFAVIYDI